MVFGIVPFLHSIKNLVLFFQPGGILFFFGVSYFNATFDLELPSSTSFNALYLSLVFGIVPFLHSIKDLVLFFQPGGILFFFGVSYFNATFDLELPSSTSFNALYLSLVFGIVPFLHSIKDLVLFFQPGGILFFFGVSYFNATFDLELPSSTSFNALYLPFIYFIFNFRLVAIVAMIQALTYAKQVCTLDIQKKILSKKK